MVSHVAATNLSRLLSRLDAKLLSASPDNPPTSLERAKMAANLEYARQLLLTLEKDSAALRNSTQRQALLSKLGEQKALIRRLNEAVQLLVHDADADDSGAGSDADSDADPMPGLVDADPPAYTQSPGPHDETAKQGLRNRFAAHKDQRAALFAGAEGTAEVPAEKALDLHREEQEALTTDMLALARQLKENSIRFGQELQKEKGLIDLAAEGLDKNVLGIEGAGRKMGSLRRDENVGWLWGILYPLIIGALMFVVLLVLLVAPKLRWW